jgi:hypothetical protein
MDRKVQRYRNGELVIVIDCSGLGRSARFWRSRRTACTVVPLAAGRFLGGPFARGGGWRWHILADPDGNEFCVLQPPDGGGL